MEHGGKTRSDQMEQLIAATAKTFAANIKSQFGCMPFIIAIFDCDNGCVLNFMTNCTELDVAEALRAAAAALDLAESTASPIVSRTIQ
jgi:hypothetical protein